MSTVADLPMPFMLVYLDRFRMPQLLGYRFCERASAEKFAAALDCKVMDKDEYRKAMLAAAKKSGGAA